MKNTLALVLVLMISLSANSQELKWNLYMNEQTVIKKESFTNVLFMKDLIPNYPSEWILDCGLTEITGICKGEAVTAASSSGTLSTAQIQLLNRIDLGTRLVIKMDFSTRNPVIAGPVEEKMNFRALVVPENQAIFPGGDENLSNYIKENVFSKLSEKKTKGFSQVILKFSINEEGEIAETRIDNTTENANTNQLIIDAINKMPKWKPAENSKGTKVKQEFELRFRNKSEGC